jgi:hypothetical protein
VVPERAGRRQTQKYVAASSVGIDVADVVKKALQNRQNHAAMVGTFG